MNKRKLASFRKLLMERLEVLRSEASKNMADEAGAALNLPDTLDLANHELTRDFTIRLRDRERKLMRKIQLALERIDDRSYGVCVACGEDIGEKRLMARPMATHCIDCKTESETQDRIRGN